MLVLSTVNALLAQLVSSSLHTAILLTPQGHLVAYSTEQSSPSEDRIRILIGLGSEVWKEGILDPSNREENPSGEESDDQESLDDKENEQVGMLECELGRLLVLPVYASTAPKVGSQMSDSGNSNSTVAPRQPVLLLALNATDEEPWGLMHTKASLHC
ncbi:hypothetical protein FRB99_006924 [Tulasnella sp. 403]|nr:hypothetical protein FRB99_006924 [Tulasnella sp. 403]